MIPTNLTGKSYCEDVFHSIARKKKKFKHFVVRNSYIIVDKNKYEKFYLNEFFKEISIRKKLLKSLNGNPIRFYIWCSFEFLNRFLRSLFSK